MEALINFISRILLWFLQAIDWFFIECLKIIGGAVVAVLNAIPVCGCFANAANFLSNLPPGVLYFARALDLGGMLQTLICCWCLRFLIRRIPFIG